MTEPRTGKPALVAIVGKSDSGKTTLVEKVVPELVKLGLRVGTVKHDAHSFEIDHPGKDSWRHGQAGAEAYVIASPERLAFIAKLDGELELVDIVRRFYDGFDIVVAEGYKRTAPHRVELFRVGAGHTEPLCAPGEAIALVTDARPRARAPVRARGRRRRSPPSSPPASTPCASTSSHSGAPATARAASGPRPDLAPACTSARARALERPHRLTSPLRG